MHSVLCRLMDDLYVHDDVGKDLPKNNVVQKLPLHQRISSRADPVPLNGAVLHQQHIGDR